MTTAVYPGTFDPMTKGHLDIICRASKLYDKLIIGVLHNSEKTPLFLFRNVLIYYRKRHKISQM